MTAPMRSLLGSLASALGNRTPVPYAPRWMQNAVPRSTVFGQYGSKTRELEAVGSVSTLFAIVNSLSESTASVEWKLYRKSTDGRRRYASDREDPRVEVTRHLALDVWNKPNQFYTNRLFTESFQQHLDLTGECYWIVVRNPGANFPLELWPVRPDRMQPVPHPTDFLTGWIYTGPDGEMVPLGVNDVIPIKMPHPTDPYRGMGPVQSLLLDLQSAEAVARYNLMFFENSAEPGGFLETDQSFSDQELAQLQTRLNEQHRGVQNAHRVAILEGGMKWNTRSFSNRDMQFTELREVNREVIREAFHFPKPMLGTVEDVNRANAEAGEATYYRTCVVPRLDRIKDVLNSVFLPMFGSTGQGVEFDYCNPVPPDREADNAELTARANAAKNLVDAGYDPAGVLEAVGLPSIDHAGPQPASPHALPAPGHAPETSTALESAPDLAARWRYAPVLNGGRRG